MKKLTSLLFLGLILILSSCGSTVYTLKGDYTVESSTVTDAEFDKVWDNVIDYFAQNNIPVATLEKSSGLIVASNVSIGESLVTLEDSNGQIMNNNAWFVFPYQKNCVGGKVVCSFNVRVRKQEDGKTFIGVNIGNIQGYIIVEFLNTMTFSKQQVTQTVQSSCSSTGNFEKHLLNKFKK